MLDIGFTELLLIAVAALIFVGPKDLPAVVRHVSKFMRELRGVYAGIRKQVDGLMADAGINDLKQEFTTTIIDLEGKPQTAYDVRELDGLKVVSGGEVSAHSTLAVGGNGAPAAPPEHKANKP